MLGSRGKGVVAHPLWSCNESKNAYDTACYLLIDPKEVLKDQLKYANRNIMIGWILFALGLPSVIAIICLIVKAGSEMTILNKL